MIGTEEDRTDGHSEVALSAPAMWEKWLGIWTATLGEIDNRLSVPRSLAHVPSAVRQIAVNRTSIYFGF
ncbi:hypothetical protein [uncultured Reyranella sp.]|uniref:hypothetical protein n=1 Tax=uncultured Reyranella sp. TaxID=735512 RepID=UPI0025D513AC|nr:hypothetical protein [uncultured Reyranella sp.]